MVTEWQNTILGSFAPLCYGKGLPERERNQTGPIPVYGSNGIVGYHDKALINKPAIIVGRKGTIGTVNYSKTPCWAIDTTFYVADIPYGDLLFTYYLLKYLRLDKFNFDSAVPGLNRDTAHNQKIQVPPLPEQKAIAHILGTLDDKIELNQQMNRNLEAIASAIFKSWFVDFDPVRAKMEDQQPAGMDAATSALFPASFENSLLGEIPKGWRVGKLGEVIAINEQSIRKDYPHQTIKYIDISSVTEGRLQGTTTYKMSEAPSRAKRLVKHGDTIWSTVRPNRKSYLFIYKPDENLIVSTGFAVLTPLLIPPSYLYSWVTTEEFVNYLVYNADGSAYPAVQPNRFSDATILLPSAQVLQAFEQQAATLRNKIAENEGESYTLAKIRDTLLPKLMSGEIRVKEAEKILEDVA